MWRDMVGCGNAPILLKNSGERDTGVKADQEAKSAIQISKQHLHSLSTMGSFLNSAKGFGTVSFPHL
jgi:hypothetical protein